MSTRKEQPPRIITKYTLSADISPSGGLTDMPIERFSKLINSTVDSSVIWPDPVHTDIGFNFTYVDPDTLNTVTFTRMVVSNNGFVVLVDDLFVTDDPEKIILRVIDDPNNDSANVIETHASYDMLLCPWFTQLQILYDDVEQDLTITPTNKFKIEHGMLDVPTFINKRLSGVWIKKCDESGRGGKRTIIRWHVRAIEYGEGFYGSVEHMGPLAFECVLYESGKIEFRYDRLIRYNNDLAAGATTFNTGTYVTCGIFPGNYVTGSNGLWRDFSAISPDWTKSRVTSPYGGAGYDAVWKDSTGAKQTPFAHSLRTSLHWFGSARNGATIFFEPPVARAQFLPRNVLRKLDTLPAGSEHVDFEAYDDRTTIAFTENNVNAPTNLQRFLFGTTHRSAEIQSLFSEDLVFPGTISQNISDDFPAYCASTKDKGAFSEDRLFTLAYDASSSFYMTGTQSSVIDGFDSKLQDKTAIRMAMPIDHKTTLYDVTGSILYYHFNKHMFQVVAPEDMRNALEYSTVDITNIGPSWSWWTTQKPSELNPIQWYWNNSNKGYSFRGFTPIGTSVSSGSIVNGFGEVGSGDYPCDYIFENWPNAMAKGTQAQLDSDVLSRTRYCPTQDQVTKFKTDYPFLVEKIVIELPIEAGPGWFNDRTRYCSIGWADTGDFAGPNNTDFGGPGLTVSLMHNVRMVGEDQIRYQTIYRNLIASGVITHAMDMSSSFDIIQSNHIPGTTNVTLSRSGFSQFGTPSAVVGSLNTTSFTGSVTIPMTAAISNGMLVTSKINIRHVSSSIPFHQILTSTFCQETIQFNNSGDYQKWISEISAFNPFQRNNGGLIIPNDGRTLFGGQFASPQGEIVDGSSIFTAKNPFYFDANLKNVPVYLRTMWETGSTNMSNVALALINFEKNTPAPYLLMPGDDLVVAISKSRPAISCSYGTTGSLNLDYYTHHDIKINTGTMYVTLYGSYVRGNKEFHDVSQRVNDSRSVYATVIGNDPVLDQFELESRFLFYQSFTDGYITGSLAQKTATTFKNSRGKTITKLLTGSRGVVFSKTFWGQNETPFVGAFSASLASQLFDTSLSYVNDQHVVMFPAMEERIYDSMMPDINILAQVEGSQIVRQSDTTWVAGAGLVLDFPRGIGLTSLYANSAKAWFDSFPFEPKYSSAKRYGDISKSIVSKTAVNMSTETLSATSAQTHDSIWCMTPQTGSLMSKFWGDVKYPPARANRSFPKNDTIKFLFGYARSYARFLSGTFGYGKVPVASNNTPISQARVTGVDLNVNVAPIIHGWKYGVFNGLPAYPACAWRRGRFGQFRDMLEQRIDTKMFLAFDPTTQKSQRDATGAYTGESPVRIKFFDKNGNITPPENTWSSNLSFEATSSVPYFDGEIRNRTDPNVKNMNLGIITMSQDLFGNIKV